MIPGLHADESDASARSNPCQGWRRGQISRRSSMAAWADLEAVVDSGAGVTRREIRARRGGAAGEWRDAPTKDPHVELEEERLPGRAQATPG